MENEARIAALVGRPDRSVTLAVLYPAEGGVHTQLALLSGAPDEPSIEVEAVVPEVVRALAAAPSGERYAMTASGRLWRQGEGGWAPVDVDASSFPLLHGATSPSDGALVVCGEQGVRAHIDVPGGAVTRAEDDVAAELLAIDGQPDFGVYAVGRGGLVLRWDGARWERLDPGTDADLYGVAVGRRSVWIAGARGVLRQYAEEQWTIFDQEAPARTFHDVALFDDQVYVAAGAEGLWFLEDEGLAPILEDVPCEHLAVAGDVLFVAGELGLGFIHEDNWQAIHLQASG